MYITCLIEFHFGSVLYLTWKNNMFKFTVVLYVKIQLFRIWFHHISFIKISVGLILAYVKS